MVEYLLTKKSLNAKAFRIFFAFSAFSSRFLLVALTA